MAVIICLLRGVNVGGRHLIKMEALRALCQSLKLRDPQTCLQSGNVVFRTESRDFLQLARKIENSIEKAVGFRPSVVLRTASEFRDIVASNPFRTRSGVEASRLVVNFLAADPGSEAREKIHNLKTDPEELYLVGRDLFIYFSIGIANSKLSMPAIDKLLKTPGTARNWNTVTKLLALAEKIEGQP